jgi:hypothetical protein
MDSFKCAREMIRTVIAGSVLPEDPVHSENTLEWLLRLWPSADAAMQIAALAHDIDRACSAGKVKRTEFKSYDEFKAAHARHSAEILRWILEECKFTPAVVDEACRLVLLHESGGDPPSDILRDADSISFFDVNLPQYFRREGWTETLRRAKWGYDRLSDEVKGFLEDIRYDDEGLNLLLNEVRGG